MCTASDVAKYFLSLQDEDAGDSITNLKLQKLLYYAQGFSLAILGKPIFKEDICAWMHGPVVQAVYHEYSEFRSSSIPPVEDFDISKYSPDERELLDEVYYTYGQFSAWRLRDMTHEESPWRDTSSNSIITHEKLKTFFLTKVK